MTAEERLIRVVLVTTPDQGTARTIAEALVEGRIAACVNILPGLTSIYRWQGDLQEDQEVLLLIKTRQEMLEGLITLVKELHPYQLPEIIALPITAGEENYLTWLLDQTLST